MLRIAIASIVGAVTTIMTTGAGADDTVQVGGVDDGVGPQVAVFANLEQQFFAA